MRSALATHADLGTFAAEALIAILVIYMAEFEIVSATIYARSGNIALAAAIESAWLAWVIAAVMPIT